jgi:lysylphosphatidylglycerol synthetase-like protein (DUF2156 family)
MPGATEFLIVKSVEKMRERGDAILSLSLSALAGWSARRPAAGDGAADDRTREFLMERLARFYDFKGLFRWKQKFAPEFEPRDLVYPTRSSCRACAGLVRPEPGPRPLTVVLSRRRSSEPIAPPPADAGGTATVRAAAGDLPRTAARLLR